MALSRYRREVLQRLADRGPLTIAVACDGHPNNIPTLINLGFVKVHYAEDRVFVGYEITDAGRNALASN